MSYVEYRRWQACGGRQPENSRKRPTFTMACSHFLLFIYSQCRTSDHTHQPRPKGSSNHFSNLIKNTQGFPFLWQLLHGQCVTVYGVSFVPHVAQTACPYSRQKENFLAHLIYIYQNILLQMCARAPGRFSCKNPITPSELPNRDTILHYLHFCCTGRSMPLWIFLTG